MFLILFFFIPDLSTSTFSQTSLSTSSPEIKTSIYETILPEATTGNIIDGLEVQTATQTEENKEKTQYLASTTTPHEIDFTTSATAVTSKPMTTTSSTARKLTSFESERISITQTFPTKTESTLTNATKFDTTQYLANTTTPYKIDFLTSTNVLTTALMPATSSTTNQAISSETESPLLEEQLTTTEYVDQEALEFASITATATSINFESTANTINETLFSDANNATASVDTVATASLSTSLSASQATTKEVDTTQYLANTTTPYEIDSSTSSTILTTTPMPTTSSVTDHLISSESKTFSVTVMPSIEEQSTSTESMDQEGLEAASIIATVTPIKTETTANPINETNVKLLIETPLSFTTSTHNSSAPPDATETASLVSSLSSSTITVTEEGHTTPSITTTTISTKPILSTILHLNQNLTTLATPTIIIRENEQMTEKATTISEKTTKSLLPKNLTTPSAISNNDSTSTETTQKEGTQSPKSTVVFTIKNPTTFTIQSTIDAKLSSSLSTIATKPSDFTTEERTDTVEPNTQEKSASTPISKQESKMQTEDPNITTKMITEHLESTTLSASYINSTASSKMTSSTTINAPYPSKYKDVL